MNNSIWLHLMLGPMMLVLAFLFKRFPPKKINYWYGYRTPRSMRSQEAWDFANQYSSNALVGVCVLTCLVQVILYFLLDHKASLLGSSVFLAVALTLVIPLTEMQLKKNKYT